MGLLGAIGFWVALISVAQIPHSAEACKILSIEPSGPSSLLIKWEKKAEATSFFLDLRVKDSKPPLSPVVISLSALETEHDTNGLWPGTEYVVTFKAFSFYDMVCIDKSTAWTGPDESQIIEAKPLSSTELMVRWQAEPSADQYQLLILTGASVVAHNLTYNGTSAVVGNLQPATNYHCYVYTVNRARTGLASKVRTITTLFQPPVWVDAEPIEELSAQVTWSPVEDVLMYNCKIQNLDDPSDSPRSWNVTDTKLRVDGILPCSNYLISVSSFSDFLVPSEARELNYTTNKLSPVSAVSVDYACTGQSAMVHWTPVPGADSYSAVATDELGDELTCVSDGSSCQVVGLRCGRDYVVKVTPISQNCRNTMNGTSATFRTVPCPPQNLMLSRNCSSNVIIFKWDNASNADHYLARAVDSKGEVTECLNEDTSCYFTHTKCGRHYHFTVYSISGTCKSEISSSVDIRTAPCIPQNLQTSSDCQSAQNGMLSKWDLAEGALRYTLQAYGNRGYDDQYNCTSVSNSCVMNSILCGEALSIYITAHDDECSSPRSLGPGAKTLPCTPTNVMAEWDCDTDSLTTTWDFASGATFYTVVATDGASDVHTCNSGTMKCTMEDLKCGTVYTLRVIASNFICNSSESSPVTVETAACPPHNINASLDCAANQAMISWSSEPHLNSFTATMEDEDQGLLSCSSTGTSCPVPNLNCGKLYTITVQYHDGACSSKPSEKIHLESVPCGPSNLRANVDCVSGGVTIDWDPTTDADGYKTLISDGTIDKSYNTTLTDLSVSDLACGAAYTVTVSSYTGTCVSFPSDIPVQEAPCVPANVVAARNCGETFVEVSWDASLGAQNYTATAVDAGGSSLACTSSAPTTSCRLEGVTCGEVYNVSVVATDKDCNSNASPGVTRPIAPCAPSHLDVSIDCGSDSAILTWGSSTNAVSYRGKAVSAQGHNVTCDAGAGLTCQLKGLQCGEEYTFTVSASDGDCDSPDSDPVVYTTAPCAVQNVVNALDCSANVLNISWTSGSMAVNYTATAVGGGGAAPLSCVTEDASCLLHNLTCGVAYNVTVTAVSGTCDGLSSETQIVNSIPCVPQNVQGVVECSNHTFLASWDAACPSCRPSYVSTLVGPGGESTSSISYQNHSVFSALECGHTYTLSVVAFNDRCNSSASAVVTAATAPCDPTNVAAAVDCSSGVASVTWTSSAGASQYTVVAEADGHVDSCTNTGVTCDLTGLQCGHTYNVTVLAGDGNCNSSALATTTVTTAPCPPQIQNHSLDCASNHATVSWAEDKDAAEVTLTATSVLGHSTSCSSSNGSSCVLDELQCGHTYSVQAVARGAAVVQCASEPSATFDIVTAPCTPANVAHTYSCASGIAILSWDESLGRSSFHATITSGNHTTTCTSTQTNCPLSSLLCGRLYNVSVTAVAQHCNSSAPGLSQIQTAPCAPENVSTSLVCANNTAAVSWLPSDGAISYKVTAQGRDGDLKECRSNGTGCDVSHLNCAQTYMITVTPSSDECEGMASMTTTFIAGPCPPSSVQASLQCAGNLGQVSWSPAPYADSYEVTAVEDHTHTCGSNGTSCSLTDLDCGQTAMVTVVTVERGCRSEASQPITLQSVICPPTNLGGVTTCSNNDITVSWNPSPESGASYVLRYHGDAGVSTDVTTARTSHVLSGLSCGDSYNLSVAAVDSDCSGDFSAAIHTDTAPCPPTNLNAVAECGTNLGMLTWASSSHAISYTATVTGTNHTASCTSNTTSCSVKLRCGKQYTASVVASSETCNSSAGETLVFNSAPCLPDQVVAALDCNANSFAVQWRGSAGDAGTYTAIAIGSDGSRVNCSATVTNCDIQNLKCGLTYSIVVTTASVNCGTIEGSDYSMQSAACKPDNVAVDLQCSNNSATVTWGNSGPNQTQVVTATDSAGRSTVVNSSDSQFTFDHLSCGETYVISVVGHTNSCSSEPTLATSLKTAPCVPTHVSAKVDCLTSITMVTWDSARGATSYTVRANGSLGHNAECVNGDTNCNFPSLSCGQDYNLTVVAHHASCDGPVSNTITASSGPCPHSGLQASLDCDTNTVLMSWTAGSGILYYNATATAFDVQHTLSSSTNGTSTNISTLLCGETYKVSVSGQGRNCSSPGQDWHRINAAPCPPTGLSVSSSCQSHDIQVSWQPSHGSFSYMAVAEDANGTRWSCNTSSTSCQIQDLPCGRSYQVYSVGHDQSCYGAKSNVEVVQTAPCVPQKLQSDLDCRAGVLNVTWQSTGHVVQFRASVASSSGHASVHVVDQPYLLVNVQCDLTYDVTVMAEDEACNSSYSSTEQVQTAPCPLSSFLPTVHCDSGVVSMSWNGSVAGVDYTVTATDGTGHQHNCTGTNSGCDLSSLECGTKYNVTITPSRSGCKGEDSPTQEITTVPCVPTISEVEIDCLTNSTWLIFQEAMGAEDYVATVTDDAGDQEEFNCSFVSQGLCAVPQLECSKNLTLTLQARDQQCSSPPSNAVVTETAPCTPQNVQNSVTCDNATISVTWSAVPGAVTYTATLEDMNGDTTCCTTTDSACDIVDLPCGELYMLHVQAEGRVCNSSQTEPGITRTAPCVPQNPSATVSCSDNVASVSWDPSKGGQLYQVTAVSADGHQDECLTPQNECELTGLRCGQVYTATVTAKDFDCPSRPSDSVTIRTAPCTPENMTSVVDCDANTLVLAWSDSPGADSYLATMQDANGMTTSCQATNQGSCNITGLGCGAIYRIFMVASDGYCDSPPTSVVDTPAGPCEPRHIQAEFDCYTETAVVSWMPSNGAVSYLVTAECLSGHNVTVETNRTSCDLEDLMCGESYSVSVLAVGESCRSVGHMTGQLDTGPCIPEHINTQYSLSIGQVLWDTSAGATWYQVAGVTDQGLLVSCSTNDTYCPLYNLVCGKVYNVSVTANNDVCQGMSTSTEEVVIATEPCPPINVGTAVNCRSDTGTVSWEGSLGAVGYSANLAGRDGHSLSCYSTGTFCEVEDLNCGVIYYTDVISVGQTLNSTASATVWLVAAPCEPGDMMFDVDCDNNTAQISWTLATGANSYEVRAVASDGTEVLHTTTEDHCELTSLQCGQTYNVTLTTISDHCQIEGESGVTFTTRPCKPDRITVDLKCGSSSATLVWEDREDMALFLATASSSVDTRHCNSTNGSCLFSDLLCGENYEFSVIAYDNECYSESSRTVNMQTEPCQPTGLTVDGSCKNDTVTLDWSAAVGAAGYVVTATSDLGYVMSFQTNDTMAEVELPCGQLFTFTVKAQDDRCDSGWSQSAEFKTVPCVPQNVECVTHCEDSLGSVSWDPSEGAESYLAFAEAEDGHVHMCANNVSTCTWDDLHCGEVYTVHVIANDDLCSSRPSNSTIIRMAPCVPENLESSLNCSIRVGSLTWNASDTADMYLVTAETNGGHKLQLSTNETWTFFSNFLCGQEYFLSVQAIDSECTSQPSAPSVLQSEPCPPTGVSSAMNCVSNIAVVSWTASAGAEFYNAEITSEDGDTIACWSDSASCGIANLVCGQNYTVSVVASDKSCNSEPSQGEILQSVPCPPVNATVAMDCSRGEAAVSWNASQGALTYVVMAQTRQGHLSNCETEDLTCTLTNLTCGLTYYVMLSAQDDTCSSLPNEVTTFNSVPCTPNIGTVVLDCFTKTALLDWSYAQGAEEYTATARSTSGHVATCGGNYTNCELMNLACGQTYVVTVVASNAQCSSAPSSSLQTDSVPCPPEDITIAGDCPTSAALVEWQSSSGADSYVVQALSQQGHESGCETTSQSCLLTDLMCGCTYNVTVNAINSVCNVSASAMIQMKTVPCVPQHVESRLVCESEGVAVSWEPSKGATSYTAVAQGNGGYASTCNSTDTTCLFSDLLCGHNYSITVAASDETCVSAESSVSDISTVPCEPQGVTAEMICHNDTAVVWWGEEEGVASYRVQAFGPDGHVTQCVSPEPACELPDLHCGQLYNLTVTAQDGECDNSATHLNLQSVPCTPTNVKASLLCESDGAAVTWERASGAVSYRAVGVTADGSHRVECNNTVTHCDLEALRCGHTYNVSVFATDDSCSSVESDTAHLRSAPCTPQNVVAVQQCSEGEMTVSWDSNPDAQSFSAVAVSDGGERLTCDTADTSCSWSALPCGRHYNVSVVSERDGCESRASATVHTSSVPCMPTNPQTHLDCISNSAWVRWDDSDGALSYHVVAEAADGHNSSCSSASSTCAIPDLKCGTRYSLTLKASNHDCHSEDSPAFELVTGPCALTSINASTECNNDTILVEWENTINSSLYMVAAEGHDLSVLYCNSTGDSCRLQDVQCGMYYSIMVSASSNRCSNLRSPPKKVKTAPCAPHNVTVVQSCEDDGVLVAWGQSHVANSYELTGTGSDGHQVSCRGLVNNCSLTDLHCGQLYSINITAIGDNCTSPPTSSSFRSAPCQPSGLSVDIDCETQSAVLSWDASVGAVTYYGSAQPQDGGDALYCDSTALSCSLDGLECGQLYNFFVEASDGVCNSSFSSPLTLGAVPCPPTDLTVRMQKIGQMHWARTWWDGVNCSDVEYLAAMEGRIQDDPEALMEVSSYWLPRTYFEFPMPCSTAYNLTVSARNVAGVGEPSSTWSGVTVPCPPQNLVYRGDLPSAVLSWDASVFAIAYTVYERTAGGRVELCSGATLSCSLTNVSPDALEVTASNDEGESMPNTDVTGPVSARRRRHLLSIDPEAPVLLNVTVKGHSVYMEWTQVEGVNIYTVEIEDQSNHSVNSTSVVGHFYIETNLKPQTLYCIQVATGTAPIKYSTQICRTTGSAP